MLTVMCPNCRHRFPAPGCCNTGIGDANISPSSPITTTTTINLNQQHEQQTIFNTSNGFLLVDATNMANNHQQQVTISTQCGIQSGGCLIQSSNAEVLMSTTSSAPQLEIRSKFSGGGCLVQKPSYQDLHPLVDGCKDEQIKPSFISEEQLRHSFEQAAQFHRSHSTTTSPYCSSRLEPPPSGCQELPGTRRDTNLLNNSSSTLSSSNSLNVSNSDDINLLDSSNSTLFNNSNTNPSPSCQIRPSESCECLCSCSCRCCSTYCRNSNNEAAATGDCRRNGLCQNKSNVDHLSRCRNKTENKENTGCIREDVAIRNTSVESSKYPGDVRIQVNATVHLPSTSSTSLTSCTLNITASTSTPSTSVCNLDFTPSNSNVSQPQIFNRNNNFNGGGIVTLNGSNNLFSSNISSTINNSSNVSNISNVNNVSNIGNISNISNISNVSNVNNLREDTPSTPISWLTSCPWWAFDPSYMPEKDSAKLAEVRRLLNTCGWYHEGLSWQQSENLLKDAPVGRWLMRDSSDSRYTFAISVQTARGPTSVRVFYFMGKFRLDAEPRLASAMPLFDCPIKMLEYYCEYSKRMDEHRREVWVDYSGQVYSQIYLSEPLVKEVRSLSHLARIAVNKNSAKLEKERERLPPVIRNYLNEYPYTL